MAIQRFHLVSLCFLFWFGTHAPALAGDAAELHRMEFAVYAARAIPDLHYGLFDEEGTLVGSQELAFRSGGRSISYNYAGPTQIVFFTPTRTFDADGQVVIERTIRAVTDLPQNLSKALIIFMQKPYSERIDGRPSHSIHLVDDSETALPWGGLTIYNATSATLLGTVGGSESNRAEAVPIHPGQNPATLIAPTGNVRLAFKFRDEFWQLVYTENFTCSVDERILLLILPPRSVGARQVRGAVIHDLRSPPE